MTAFRACFQAIEDMANLNGPKQGEKAAFTPPYIVKEVTCLYSGFNEE